MIEESDARCPGCGSARCATSEERLRPDWGPVPAIGYVVGMVLMAWQGFSRIARPYTTQGAYGVAVAMMALGVIGMVALTVIFLRMRRARPCKVRRCPDCGRAVALDAPPARARGWRLR